MYNLLSHSKLHFSSQWIYMFHTTVTINSDKFPIGLTLWSFECVLCDVRIEFTNTRTHTHTHTYMYTLCVCVCVCARARVSNNVYTLQCTKLFLTQFTGGRHVVCTQRTVCDSFQCGQVFEMFAINFIHSWPRRTSEWQTSRCVLGWLHTGLRLLYVCCWLCMVHCIVQIPPKVKSRALGVRNTSSLSCLSAWKIIVEIAPNTTMAIPRCLILLEVNSLIPIHYSMEHSSSWESNRYSASQEIPSPNGTLRFITAFTSSRRSEARMYVSWLWFLYNRL